MIYINLGFPKTGTTNLQINFYPYLKKINYLGKTPKFYKGQLIKINYLDKSTLEKKAKLFNELNNFVENRVKFSDLKLDNLINDFVEYYNIHKKILISNENWLSPYQKNNFTKKIEIVDQETKLNNINLFFKKCNIPYKFFLINRDPEQLIPSYFATMQNRINRLWGENFLSFDFFLSYVDQKKDKYENQLLLFHTFNIKKITKIISKEKLKIFEYSDILYNKEKFIFDLSTYLEIPAVYNLIEKLKIKMRVTPITNDNSYKFYTPNILFKILKFLIPEFLKKKLIFLLKINYVKFSLFKEIKINRVNNNLKKIIKEYY